MSINLKDLGVAYRKAKVDIYYSSHANLSKLAEYEEELHSNLSALKTKLNGKSRTWIRDEGFLGDWFPAAKSIKPALDQLASDGPIFSSPEEQWLHHCESAKIDNKEMLAEFRVMADVSVDFHVLSSLWMLKVGHLYDDKLSKCAYGNRLRRTKEGRINPLSLGSFTPYLAPFRNWRDNGIKAMKSALASNKRIVAITGDVNSFYHRLNADFMLDHEFNALLGIDLDAEQKKIHELFIEALTQWSKLTPIKNGLPVGLPASAVVANVALFELDRLIEQQVVPLYYGRYVDDIMLVMENGSDFKTASEVWAWIFKRTKKRLAWVDDKKKDIKFFPNYLGGSDVQFSNEKNKIFLLQGEAGLAMVRSIVRQIHERASEWRSLPVLPASPEQVGTDLIAARHRDGDAVDNLRKADSITMRRASFALKLRDFEAYERDLLPSAWRDHRHTFLAAVTSHVVSSPHQLFELSIYLPRVIKLATACRDFVQLRALIDALHKVVASIEENCKASIKSCKVSTNRQSSRYFSRWKKHLSQSVFEAVASAFPNHQSGSNDAWATSMEDRFVFDPIREEPFGAAAIGDLHEKLFSYDLAHMPFRFRGLPKEMVSRRGIPKRDKLTGLDTDSSIVPETVFSAAGTISNWIKLKGHAPHGIVFATRPFSIDELYIIAAEPLSRVNSPLMRAAVLGTRGFVLSPQAPYIDDSNVVHVPHLESSGGCSIAVSSWKTEFESWIAAVSVDEEPDSERYRRVIRLMNTVINGPDRPRYLVLPELALPANWFMRVARKLRANGTSLITGIQYLHARRRRVRHQVWASLSHNALGFPSGLIYRQEKQRPAYHEELELSRVGGLTMTPKDPWERATPPIVRHGNLNFAILVCSELTNIEYRASLRGRIDVLFVPEWNPDTETFNSLVEASALDIHAYIVQCNDREYGDSRIRAPFKDSWKRDILRVKGGTSDYCVTGIIDVTALRRFQSSFRSPSGPFKPVPDGFRQSAERKMLPFPQA